MFTLLLSRLRGAHGSNQPRPSWITMMMSAPLRYFSARRVLSRLSIPQPAFSSTAAHGTLCRNSSISVLCILLSAGLSPSLLTGFCYPSRAAAKSKEARARRQPRQSVPCRRKLASGSGQRHLFLSVQTRPRWRRRPKIISARIVTEGRNPSSGVR